MKVGVAETLCDLADGHCGIAQEQPRHFHFARQLIGIGRGAEFAAKEL